jgi:hypothetical protein
VAPPASRSDSGSSAVTVNYDGGYPAVTLADHDALRAVLGTGVYLGLLAVFALGVGAVLRHTAGAITVVLAALLARR